MKDVDQNHQGVELGVEETLFTSHVVQGALGYGQFLYTSRPTLEAWQYNNPEAIFKDRTTYLKNYKVGGSPQLVAGFGYKYNGKKFWFAGINLNYFDEIYIEPNPDRRTSGSGSGYMILLTVIIQVMKNRYKKIVDQEKLPTYFIVNLNGGKSFRIAKKILFKI
ncbi:MAG: hypothetical protein IPJ32_10700 [Sphingobacteriaceae bacterium]|nr:hypothetical protein [Sphingobacteriaceae bacterium]